jgi:DNA repair exonuclease SbcCD ATPase subunit
MKGGIRNRIVALLATPFAAALRFVQSFGNRHEGKIEELRKRSEELITKYTKYTDDADAARVFGEEMKRRAERIEALHARIDQLDAKCTASFGQSANKLDEEVKRLAGQDNALSQKVASLAEQLAEIERKFSLNFEELARHLSATKVVIPQRTRSDLQGRLSRWRKVTGLGRVLMAAFCGLALGDDAGDATLGSAFLEEQIQSLGRRLDSLKADFELGVIEQIVRCNNTALRHRNGRYLRRAPE